jgi:hypothetical protein
MVGIASLIVAAGVTLAGVAEATAQPYVVRVACRDGLPTGAYELRNPDGHLRVAGAFEHGRRSGSFFFWTSTGVRIAQLPFDQDVMNGTVALWYSKTDASGEGPRKLVAEYRKGRPHGTKRSWYPNGRRRTEIEYADGEIQSAAAWSVLGKRWSDAASRELAARDARDDAAYLASLDDIVHANHGACEGDAAPVLETPEGGRAASSSKTQEPGSLR